MQKKNNNERGRDETEKKMEEDEMKEESINYK
jgi:hypothetical protein